MFIYQECTSETGQVISECNDFEPSESLSDVNLVDIIKQNVTYFEEFLIVKGTAKNIGNRTLNCIKISAKFYDKDGILLDVGHSFPEHYINPGEQWIFKCVTSEEVKDIVKYDLIIKDCDISKLF